MPDNHMSLDFLRHIIRLTSPRDRRTEAPLCAPTRRTV